MGERSRWSRPFTVASTIAGLALLPIWLPVVLMLHALDARRMRAVARKTICLQCGFLLTDESLVQAAKLWAEYVAQKQRDHPTTLFRLVRPYDAICLACGQAYRWLEQDLIWQPVDNAESSGG